MKRIILACLLLSAGVLAACGDDDPAAPTPVLSEFQLSVTGDVTETATGPAWFGADVDDDGEPVFALLLGQDTSRHLVIAGRSGSARPGTGSYAIREPDAAAGAWSLLHLLSDGDELLGMFVADSGTVTITESTPQLLRGSMEFHATGVLGQEDATVRVTGTFRAAPAPGR